MPRPDAFEPIAVVGQSCVLPGALSPAQLWEAVAAGRDLTSAAPAGRWGLPRRLALAEPSARSADQAWCDRGGYVRGFEEIFDARGFALPAEEVLALDPLFQWVLHTGREALAGAAGGDPDRTGVVLGNLSFPSVGASRFAESVWRGTGGAGIDPRNHFMSGLPALLLARALGLGGKAFALDAACASSLVAVKLACDRLHDRSADLMLAGAVSCADDLFIHIGFCALEAMSPSGRSRPFHRDADGLLPAEGAACVALERLSDAVRHGHEILGIIRGVGLSNDGRGGGLLAPSEDGQERAIAQAYARSGLTPADVSLIECHATGTRVGDAAEIRSLGRLYAGSSGVPIGSLKSNLGHLITTAGLAGLLKVLAATKAGVRPPTRLEGPANPVLEGSPFRLLEEAEPWTATGPRRAAVSAFGFGGNNAHLLVEEWPGDADAAPLEPPRRAAAAAPVAIVGLAAVAAGDGDTGAFARTLFSGRSRLTDRGEDGPAGRMESIELPLAGLGFPPRDLEQTLPQQLLLLAAARQAVAALESELPRPRTGVLIGMRCDAEIARYGLRWRLAGDGVDPAWLGPARDAVVGGLQAAGVVGTMPNMTANRLNSMLDLGGASASISSEELSGLDALDLARRALAAGEIDAALVGAADLACEPVHEAAVRLIVGDRIPGDAATVLIVKRLADARRDGDRIFALVETAVSEASKGTAHPGGLRLFADEGDDEGLRLDLTPQLGCAHAASGLLHVAAAALALDRRAIPAAATDDGAATPWLCRGPRRAEVSANTFAGRSARVLLRQDESRPAPASLAGEAPRIHFYSGADRAEVRARLDAGEERPPPAPAGPARLALVAGDAGELEDRRQAARRLLAGDAGDAATPPRGVYFRDAPLAGELAFVFTGAGAAYRGMGRELFLALPQLLDRLGRRMSDLPAAAGWVYAADRSAPLGPLQQLWGSSFLSQGHAELSRGILGLEPDAVLGYSSGESNSLMALGAWNDLDALYRDTVECGLFTRELGGDFAAIARRWGAAGGAWANWVLGAPVDRVRQAIAAEERVRLTLISSPEDVAIGGEAAACRRVIDALGAPAYPLGYDLAVHCPEVEEVAEAWLELHRRETADVPGVRFYTHSTLDSYRPSRESAAQAILGQAVRTLDFPALVAKAFDDGVRVFLEHGPRGLCSGWIGKILAHRGVGDADYLAVPLDRPGEGSLRQTVEAAARLLVAGVDVRWDVFHRAAETAPEASRTLSFPAHWPPIALPSFSSLSLAERLGVRANGGKPESLPMPAIETPTDHGQTQVMAPAPTLPPVLDDFVPATPATAALPAATALPAQPPAVAVPALPALAARPAADAIPADLPLVAYAGGATVTTASIEPAAGAPRVFAPAGLPVDDGVLGRLSELQARIAEAQKGWVSTQTALHRQFLALRQRSLSDLVLAFSAAGVASPEASGPPPAPIRLPEPRVARALVPPTPAPSPEPGVAKAAAPTPPVSPAARTDGELPGLKLCRRQLEVLASGKVSSIFGPLFARQDGYARQTRMPEPPFLLADRVTGLDAEPGTMGTGTIWTETDVTPDSWYLHRGHMPGGLMIEAGQADLLLISWLGVDFLNRGERIYRLLGCELTYRGGLPRPGDTLAYDIHVDGHAHQGDVRLFFFHYDCRIDGEVRLEVRHGQAGFFTDQELAESAGVLWDPAAETPAAGRVDAPRALPARRAFSPEQMVAFSEGRVFECFGAGFELAASHTLTPTIQDGRMLLLERVSDLDPGGGPWRRGYLRAVTALRPDSWIFEGHFKNDPCMPGTLMLEGCFQALSFYLAALGLTLERDGWRFEPVPDETYLMRCRGQAVPSSKELVYELFVHEVIAGPEPTVFADMMCTVDGLKAFHARRLGLRLVPDWPLSLRPEMLEQPFPGGERPAGRPVAEANGFRFDHASLLACAWGRPSAAFGEMYRVFDSPRRVARLPGPPYHFMSRVASIDGEMGRFTPGAVLEAEYDVPPGEWYFAENGHPVMPFAVLLEVGLQPCGWLASYVGSALTTGDDLQFRNLDGTGTMTAEVDPGSGILASRVKLVATSSSAGVLIVRFEVAMRDAHRDVYRMDTAFGFFPASAMENQVGLPATAEERAWLTEPSDVLVDLTARPERYGSAPLGLAGSRLLMIDRVTGFWPEAGKAGLGRLRAEKDVDPGEWFFQAHFFSDPVQPGSLGIEAMVQALQFYMLQAGLDEGIDDPRFEALATDRPLTWKYRGQVLPTNRLITTELEIVEVGTDERGAYALADAFLWVDGKRIYSATNLGMRIIGGVSGAAVLDLPDAETQVLGGDEAEFSARALEAETAGAVVDVVEGEEILDPSRDVWIADHCPTWTLPALPMMSMVDRLAAAAAGTCGELQVVGLEDVRVERWVAFSGGPLRLKTEVAAEERCGSEIGAVDVVLSVWRDAATAALSRFEVAATGRVLMARSYGSPPQPLPALDDAEEAPDPYASGDLFHGPAFQLLRKLSTGAAGGGAPGCGAPGSTALLDAGAGSVPRGTLHQALLDAATHGIPHADLHRWCEDVPEDVVAYPHRLSEARFYGPPPTRGEIRCEARFERYDPETREVVFHLQLLVGERPWADLRLREVLLPKGPLGSAPAADRRAFLRDRAAVPGLGLSRAAGDGTRLSEAEVAASDWLAGTVARAYAVSAPGAGDRSAISREVAVKDHVARRAGVHPAAVDVEIELSAPGAATELAASAVARTYPLTRFDVTLRLDGQGGIEVADRAAPRLDVGLLRRYWTGYLGLEDWLVEDVYYGLIERFVRRVVVTDPDGLAAIHGRGTLFLANHQVMIESLLFSTVASALVGTPTVTLAKAEHRTSWLGRLIAHCFSYPGVVDPEVIAFFERDNMRSLPLIIRQLRRRMKEEARSVAVHCEGTRSLTCRQGVTALAGSFIDMAMKADAAIVPVRFVGGLPAEPLAKRIEFPLGFGRQDYWLGSPLEPEELAKLPYKDRRQAVIDAINGLGPDQAEEEPLPGDPGFGAEVEAWIAATGAAPEQAVIYKTVAQLARPGSEAKRLIAAVEAGRLAVADDEAGRWLAEIARRFFGARGPRVDVVRDPGGNGGRR